MSLSSFVIAASESHDDAVNPYVIGGVALGLLLFSLFVVLCVAGGREHS